MFKKKIFTPPLLELEVPQEKSVFGGLYKGEPSKYFRRGSEFQKVCLPVESLDCNATRKKDSSHFSEFGVLEGQQKSLEKKVFKTKEKPLRGKALYT
jgi:hypothetical protein